MLSAQKQENPSEFSAPPQAVTTGGDFARVITSLKGLQERLEEILLDDVTEAESQANTVIAGLTELQSKLLRFALLKDTLALTTQRVRQIPAPDYDLVNLDSLAKHPQLHALVKASKLIKFLKLVRATKARTAEHEIESQSQIKQPIDRQFDISRENLGWDLSSVNQPITEDFDRQTEEPPTAPINNQFLAATHALASSTAASSLAVFMLEPSSEMTHSSDTPENTPAKLATEFRGQEPSLSASEIATPANIHDEPYSFPILANENGADNATNVDARFVMTATRAPGHSAEQSNATSSIGSDPSANVIASRASTAANFDQRLLDDLIKNYGEFTPLTKSHSANATQSAKKPETFEQTVPAPQASVPADLADSNESIDQQSFTETLTKNEILSATPGAQFPESFESIEARLPRVRQHGELDLELKKIIKDYGEFDLYSNQRSINPKTAGIAAFVVLAFVFGAIYFFKSPKSIPNAPAAITQPQTSPENQLDGQREPSEKTIKDNSGAAKDIKKQRTENN